MAFEPPTDYNSTVMVNKTFQFVSPTVEELTAANPILTYNSNIAQASAATAQTAATNAAQSATTAQQAAAQAVEITDPEGWRTDTRAMISDLAANVVKKGILNIKLAKATSSLKSVPPVLSILFDLQMDYADWVAAANYATLIGWHNTGNNGAMLYRGNSTMAFQYIGGGTSVFAEIPASTRQSICDGNLNSIALIVNSQGFFIYKNGAKIYTYSSTTFPTEEWTAENGFAVGGITMQKCKIGRVRLFNFDVSATGAPYTLSNFQNGVEIPFTLLDASAESRAILALEDFTYTAGAAKKISDYGGGGYDASISVKEGGYFIGDNDTRVAALKRMINLWTQS